MKWLILIVIACDQQLLDQFYLVVEEEKAAAAVEKLHRINEHYQYQVDYEEPAPISFELFHKLCHGQKSLYERNENENDNVLH